MKRKKPRKMVQMPSITENVPKAVEEKAEEDLKDTIPLNQRTRAARAATKERRKSQSPPSSTTQENPVRVEELTKAVISAVLFLSSSASCPSCQTVKNLTKIC